MKTLPQRRRTSESGMTLSELLIVVAIIGILSVVAIQETSDAVKRARLSACMLEMRQIQRVAYSNSDGGMAFPTEQEVWDIGYLGTGPRGIRILYDEEDTNRGHGNDLDGFDEQNPGNAPRTRKDIHMVIICQHDHGRYADYVYLEDEGPPLFAFKGPDDPRYDRFIGRPGGGGGSGGGGDGGGGSGGGDNGGGGNGGGGNGNGGGGNGNN